MFLPQLARYRYTCYLTGLIRRLVRSVLAGMKTVLTLHAQIRKHVLYIRKCT